VTGGRKKKFERREEETSVSGKGKKKLKKETRGKRRHSGRILTKNI